MNRTLIFLIAISVFASCKKSSNNDDTSNQKCRLSSWHTQGEHNYKFHYNNNNQLTEINWIDDYYGTFRKCTFNYYQDKITYNDKGDTHEWTLANGNVTEYQDGKITYTNGYITKIDDGDYQTQFAWSNGNLLSLTTIRASDNSKDVVQLEYYTDKANIVGFDWGIEQTLDIIDDNNPPVTPTMLFGKYSKNLLKSIKSSSGGYSSSLSYDYENGTPIRIIEAYKFYDNSTGTNIINLQYNCK